jgi:hypothetical protein
MLAAELRDDAGLLDTNPRPPGSARVPSELQIDAKAFSNSLLSCSTSPGSHKRAFAPRLSSGFIEDALVVGLVGGDDIVGAEVFLGVDAGGFAHFAAAVGAGQEFDGVTRRFLYISGFD